MGNDIVENVEREKTIRNKRKKEEYNAQTSRPRVGISSCSFSPITFYFLLLDLQHRTVASMHTEHTAADRSYLIYFSNTIMSPYGKRSTSSRLSIQ